MTQRRRGCGHVWLF